MPKLTKTQIDLIQKFSNRFNTSFEVNGQEVSIDDAIKVFEGELLPEKTKEQRLTEFQESLRPHLLKYGKDMLNKFYRYWAAYEGVKYKFETQKTWDLELRLNNWKRNDEEYERKKYIQQLNNRM